MIKGLNPRLAEIGKIKIGGKSPEKKKSKKGTEYQLPIKFNHFVVTTTEKGPDNNFLINQDIMKKLEKEPKEISIRLPFDSIDMNFYTQYAYYQGNKCLCRGDGEKATRIINSDKNPTPKHIPCNPEMCEFMKSEKCKVSGILSCFLACSMEIGGVYRFRTHSWNTVSNILASLEYFSEQTNGILQGLPLKLKIIKKATQDHGNVRTVTIVLDGIQFMEMRKLATSEYNDRMQLGINMKQIETRARDAGFLDDTDEPKDIQEEFYPIEEPEEIAKPEKGTSPNQVKEKVKKAKEKPPEPEPEPEETETGKEPQDLF